MLGVLSTSWGGCNRVKTRKNHLPNGCGSKPMVPFWGGCTTHFRTYFCVDWDVHWGYDLDFDPWPNGAGL